MRILNLALVTLLAFACAPQTPKGTPDQLVGAADDVSARKAAVNLSSLLSIGVMFDDVIVYFQKDDAGSDGMTLDAQQSFATTREDIRRGSTNFAGLSAGSWLLAFELKYQGTVIARTDVLQGSTKGCDPIKVTAQGQRLNVAPKLCVAKGDGTDQSKSVLVTSADDNSYDNSQPVTFEVQKSSGAALMAQADSKDGCILPLKTRIIVGEASVESNGAVLKIANPVTVMLPKDNKQFAGNCDTGIVDGRALKRTFYIAIAGVSQVAGPALVASVADVKCPIGAFCPAVPMSVTSYNAVDKTRPDVIFKLNFIAFDDVKSQGYAQFSWENLTPTQLRCVGAARFSFSDTQGIPVSFNFDAQPKGFKGQPATVAIPLPGVTGQTGKTWTGSQQVADFLFDYLTCDPLTASK